MNNLMSLPFSGLVVIFIILCLFVLSVILLFTVVGRYKVLAARSKGDPNKAPGFIRHVYNEYKSAYERFGDDTNTPVIIEDCISSRLGGMLLCERLLNNAVSLFVTLGLFGTFLGLSLSVQSLTKLLAGTNSSEWLSVLDNVGSGLLSALSGMGVAFYTSLVGVACSILLTILRAIFNPENERASLQTRLEIWLDNYIAVDLKTEAVRTEFDLAAKLIASMNAASSQIETSIGNATDALMKTSVSATSQLQAFDSTIGKFNKGIRDFSDLDYNLRGSIERLDLSVRELRSTLDVITRAMEGSNKNS